MWLTNFLSEILNPSTHDDELDNFLWAWRGGGALSRARSHWWSLTLPGGEWRRELLSEWSGSWKGSSSHSYTSSLVAEASRVGKLMVSQFCRNSLIALRKADHRHQQTWLYWTSLLSWVAFWLTAESKWGCERTQSQVRVSQARADPDTPVGGLFWNLDNSSKIFSVLNQQPKILLALWYFHPFSSHQTAALSSL